MIASYPLIAVIAGTPDDDYILGHVAGLPESSLSDLLAASVPHAFRLAGANLTAPACFTPTWRLAVADTVAAAPLNLDDAAQYVARLVVKDARRGAVRP